MINTRKPSLASVAVTALSGLDRVNALVGSSEDLNQLVPTLNLNNVPHYAERTFGVEARYRR